MAYKEGHGTEAVDKVDLFNLSSIRRMNRKRRKDYRCNNRKAWNYQGRVINKGCGIINHCAIVTSLE